MQLCELRHRNDFRELQNLVTMDCILRTRQRLRVHDLLHVQQVDASVRIGTPKELNVSEVIVDLAYK